MPPATRSLRTALAVVCALALAGCSSGSGTGDAQVTYAPQHRKAAPDLAGATLKGATFSLAAQRGHVVVVNFWASWCDPCRDEADALDQVATELAPGVTFIGIAFHGDVKANALAFLHSHGVPYDSLYDPDSQYVLKLAGKVSVAAPPLTMIIDKQGRIATVINGEVDYTHFKAAVVAANDEAAA
ncbi:TlpA disulfide reductase family protein [Acidothermaceae bacterium B102]|nr:TlpA disulfide reductase family protein [Acidothermaceae bacterium B102]